MSQRLNKGLNDKGWSQSLEHYITRQKNRPSLLHNDNSHEIS